MGLDQFFYEVREDESVNEDNQIFYFRKNWDFHWDLERYFDTEIANFEYFTLTIDDILEMVDIEDFYCLKPILDKMIDKGLSEILYQPWWWKVNMNEIILTDEDMNLMYDAIDNMSQEALDSWTEYIFGMSDV